MKKLIATILALLLAVSLLPASAFAAGGDGTSTYRALLMYCSGDVNLKEGPKEDSAGLKTALSGASNFEAANITEYEAAYKGRTVKREIGEAMAARFAGSDEDDVNLIYWSGHGSYGYGQSYLAVQEDDQMSASELRALTEDIPGKFVVLLDCCNSGGIVSKGPASAASFESDFCRSFGEALNSPGSGATAKSAETDLTGSDKYKVLAAAAYQQVSWQFGIGGAFTTCVDRGLGYCGWDDNYSSFAADTNGDGAVTLMELYRWVSRENVSSVTRCYPEYDDTVIATYNKAANPARAITASMLHAVLPVSENAELDISYFTTANVPVYCEGLYSDYYFGADDFKPTEKIDKIYTNLNYGSYKGQYLSPVVQSSEGMYAGSDTLTFDTTGIGQGIYYLRLLPEGGGAAYFPVMIVPETDGILSDPDMFSAEISTTDYAVTDASRSELRVRITFDDDWSLNGYEDMPNYFSSGVVLSCRIVDGSGLPVRTLASNAIGEYLYDSQSEKYISYNDFYWDGKDAAGNYVLSGEYTVSVYADYYSCTDGALSKITLSKSLPVTVATPNSLVALSCYTNGSFPYAEKEVLSTAKIGDAVNAPPSHNPGWTFAGWFASELGETETEPELLSGDSPVGNNTALYAVFTDGYKWVSNIAGADAVNGENPGITTAYNGDGTVQLSYKAGTEAGKVTVYVAAYSAEGRMLAVKSCEFSADGFAELALPEKSKTAACKVFALRNNDPAALVAYR